MKYLKFVLLALVVLTADQLTKWLALTHLDWHQSWRLTSYLNLSLTYNRGAAFSFLNNNSHWTHMFFVSLAVVISMVLFVWLKHAVNKNHILESSALSLILGGALGNLFDRLQYGYVIDFIDVHLGAYHWPVFNVADSVICIGALIILIVAFYQKEKTR